MGDTRTDPGQYYPGGRVVSRRDVAPPQIVVQWSDVQGKPQIAPLPDRYREDDMKGKINEIASKFATALAVALVGWTAFAGVTVHKARMGSLWNDEQIVTNVTYSAEAETDPTVPAWAKEDTPPQTMTTNAVRDIANATVVTNALTVATTNRVAALETATGNILSSVSDLSSSKADKSALNAHVENTNNPHAVTAEQIGAVPFVEDKNGNKTAVTIGSRKSGEPVGLKSLANGGDTTASGYCSHAEGDSTTASGYCSHAEGSYTTASGYYSHSEGYSTTASGYYSHAEGDSTTASGYCSHAEGSYTTASGYCSHAEGYKTTASGDCSHAGGQLSQTKEGDAYAFAWNGDASKTEEDPYKSHGPGTFNINPAGGLNGFYIGEQTLAGILLSSVTNNISATNPTFSNAVLAVGLNIDTNSVAVLNEVAATFGGFPIEGTATTVGGLLAALAAVIAWLKKNKVGSFDSVGGATATVENGVAKLSDFFTESNSLLTVAIDDRLPIPISEKSEGFTTESYKRFVVTVSGDMTVTLHTPTSGDAEIFECRFNGASLSADASITFAGATATTMDANCGTVTAGKVALMSAFWNGTTWDVNWKVEG